MSKTIKQATTFEDALKRLEEIVALMESGESDLDTMLQLFEEGRALTRFCSDKLNEVEKKIEKITAVNTDGTVVTQEFSLQ